MHRASSYGNKSIDEPSHSMYACRRNELYRFETMDIYMYMEVQNTWSINTNSIFTTQNIDSKRLHLTANLILKGKKIKKCYPRIAREVLSKS